MKFKIISLVEIELLNAADPKKLINDDYQLHDLKLFFDNLIQNISFFSHQFFSII